MNAWGGSDCAVNGCNKRAINRPKQAYSYMHLEKRLFIKGCWKSMFRFDSVQYLLEFLKASGIFSGFGAFESLLLLHFTPAFDT